MLGKYRVPVKPQRSSNWTKTTWSGLGKASWSGLKICFGCHSYGWRCSYLPWTNGWFWNLCSSLFMPLKTVQKCPRVRLKGDWEVRTRGPLRHIRQNTRLVVRCSHQITRWNGFSAGDPVALCAKHSTDTSRVMILIHTAAIHVKVCASYWGYSSASGPRGRAPPPPCCTYCMWPQWHQETGRMSCFTFGSAVAMLGYE